MFEEYGFPAEYPVEGRASIADLFKPEHRCGIYILHFKNDQYYAGLAIDVVRRYAQHRLNHTDIVKISFKTVPQLSLSEEERSLIWTLERQNFVLRNITFTGLPPAESDFDLIMPLADQQAWLQGHDLPDTDSERIGAPERRLKYTAHYQRLLRQPEVKLVIDVLRTYAQIGIPIRRRSEISFWCSSCLPTPHVFSRININWQEVLTVYRRTDGAIWSSFHLAASPITALSDSDLEQLTPWDSAGYSTDHYYEPGGQDQLHVEIPIEDMLRFLAEPAIQSSIRLFNWRLMKKGPCIYGRYHCLDLADHLVD